MSVPYGTPPPGPRQPAPPGPTVDRREPTFILTMIAAGAGLVGYVIGFFDESTAAGLASTAGLGFIVAAALAGMRVLPRVPNTLHAAAPLSLYAMLALLQSIVGGSPSGIVVVLLLLMIVQLGSLVGVLLLEAGLITAPGRKTGPAAPRPPMRPGQPGPQPGPQHSGPFPQQGAFGQGQAPTPQSGPHTGPQSGAPAGPQPTPQSGPHSGQQPKVGATPPPPPQPAPGQPQGSPPWNPGSAPSPTQQPGGWNPSSGETGVPETPSKPGGPQGTQQMPHPGASTD